MNILESITVFDIIKLCAEFFFAGAVSYFTWRTSKWIHRNQKIANKKSKTMTCLTDLFSFYKETMKKIDVALTEAQNLEKYLEDCKAKNDFSGFNKEYYSPKYYSLLDVHYFFELMGTLMRQRQIDKDTVHHCFSFPIQFFMETENMRKLIRENKCLPSYGENLCRMFMFYNDAKIKENFQWVANGQVVSFDNARAMQIANNWPFIEDEEKDD